MARPLKKGLEYFPLDTSLDIKLQLLKARYKLEGIGFIDMLYRIIYNEGYYIEVTPDNKIILSAEFGIEETRFDELLSFCIEKNFFDAKIWGEHKVLTSNGIQKRYFHNTTRRVPKNDEQEHRYIITETPELFDNNPDSADNKYTKESKVKEKKSKYKECVFLFDYELQKLTTEYGKEFIDKCISKLDNYKASKGKRYKSDYRAILSWVIEAVKEQELKNGKSSNGLLPKEIARSEWDTFIGNPKLTKGEREKLSDKYLFNKTRKVFELK